MRIAHGTWKTWTFDVTLDHWFPLSATVTLKHAGETVWSKTITGADLTAVIEEVVTIIQEANAKGATNAAGVRSIVDELRKAGRITR